jgi:1-acyl-sn-glycerol-3-phosphate acyltransferase
MPSFATIVRLAAMVSYLCLVLPVMWMLTVFRLVHGSLRKLGLPNRWLPLDVVSWLFSRGVLFFSGVEVEIRGAQNVAKLPVTVFMPNHSSGLDPFLVTGTAPMNPVFVFKRELIFYFPPVFLMGWIYGHIPIVRSKRESAINSLSKAAKKISKYHRSVCIFPEGTRSVDGKVFFLSAFLCFEQTRKGFAIEVRAVLHG